MSTSIIDFFISNQWSLFKSGFRNAIIAGILSLNSNTNYFNVSKALLLGNVFESFITILLKVYITLE